MKWIVCLAIIVISVHPVWAASLLSVGFDVMACDVLFSESATLRLDTTLELSEEFSLRLPVTVTLHRQVGGPYWIEGGIFLDYHLCGWPLHLSLSLAQVGVVGRSPYADTNQVFFLNEMGVGWPFILPSGLVIEPRLTIRDPNRAFSEEYESLTELFSDYRMVRFALLIGWAFPVGLPRGQ